MDPKLRMLNATFFFIVYVIIATKIYMYADKKLKNKILLIVIKVFLSLLSALVGHIYGNYMSRIIDNEM